MDAAAAVVSAAGYYCCYADDCVGYLKVHDEALCLQLPMTAAAAVVAGGVAVGLDSTTAAAAAVVGGVVGAVGDAADAAAGQEHAVHGLSVDVG